MSRNRHLERQLFEQVTRLAATQHGVDASDLIRRVNARLELGDDLYGATYLLRDNTLEAQEEAEDLVAYVALELGRLTLTGRLHSAALESLVRAAVLATASDHHLHAARQDPDA